MVSFKDRVVVITGGAGALGSAYSRLFASRGAKVLINDINISVHGVPSNGQASNGNHNPALDALVAEINGNPQFKANGGHATANYENVSNSGAIIDHAIKAYGRVDVVIANAGFLMDASMDKMTRQQWDSIIEVGASGHDNEVFD